MVEELADGAVVVELLYAGDEWLAGEMLKEAGDAAVLEPRGRARGGAARPPRRSRRAVRQ